MAALALKQTDTLMAYTHGTWTFRHPTLGAPRNDLRLLAKYRRWGWLLKTQTRDAAWELQETSKVFRRLADLQQALRESYSALVAEGWELTVGTGMAAGLDLRPIDGGQPTTLQRSEFTVEPAEGLIPMAVAVIVEQGGSHVSPFRAAVIAGNDHDHAHFGSSLEGAMHWHASWVRHFNYLAAA